MSHRRQITTLAVVAGLALAGCGTAASTARHTTIGPSQLQRRVPAQVSRLQACLGQHVEVSQDEDGFVLDYHNVTVEVYPSVEVAKAATHHAPGNPGLETQIRTGNVVVSIGDAIRGGEARDAARIRKCLQ
jgi:hypothetical protein